MTQPAFVFARDTHVTDPDEQVRLSGQSLRILERLRQGPATNRELAEISLKYTSRLSDCRHAGYDIRCVQQDRKSGLAVYELVEA